MCGRYAITTPPEAMRRVFRFEGPTPNLPPRWNVAPTQDAPVIRRSAGGGRELRMMRWGLVPFWAKDASGAGRMINARGETVAEKPAYRHAFKTRRCLVPADGFYEWPENRPPPKRAILFRMKDGEPFAFAGLWETWRPEGGRSGDALETFTIVNTAANDLMARYHHRIPVVLAPDDYDAWLDPGADPRALLKPPPSDWFTATPVGTHVNNVRNDDPRCFEPVEDEAPPPAPRATRKRAAPAKSGQGELF